MKTLSFITLFGGALSSKLHHNFVGNDRVSKFSQVTGKYFLGVDRPLDFDNDVGYSLAQEYDDELAEESSDDDLAEEFEDYLAEYSDDDLAEFSDDDLAEYSDDELAEDFDYDLA